MAVVKTGTTGKGHLVSDSSFESKTLGNSAPIFGAHKTEHNAVELGRHGNGENVGRSSKCNAKGSASVRASTKQQIGRQDSA